MSAPDVIVGWLQNDYGQLGRAGEAVAHALVRSPAGGRVAYVEPFHPHPGEAQLGARVDRDLLVFTGMGTPPTGTHEVARGVVEPAELDPADPAQLRRLGGQLVAALRVRPGVLAHRARRIRQAGRVDRDGVPRRAILEGVRAQLIAASDVVCGLSERFDRRHPRRTLRRSRRRRGLARPRGRRSARASADLAPIGRPRAVTSAPCRCASTSPRSAPSRPRASRWC